MRLGFHEIKGAGWSSSAYPPSTVTMPSVPFIAASLASWPPSRWRCAVHAMLSAEGEYARLEINTNLLRAMAVETGRLLCEGKTIHVGRSVAVAEACLTMMQVSSMLT